MSKGQALKSFFGEVLEEMRKTVWPGKDELIQSTLVVIVSLFLLGVFVGVCDWTLVKLVGLLTKV